MELLKRVQSGSHWLLEHHDVVQHGSHKFSELICDYFPQFVLQMVWSASRDSENDSIVRMIINKVKTVQTSNVLLDQSLTD